MSIYTSINMSICQCHSMCMVRWPGRVTARFQIAPLPNCSDSKLRRFQIGLNCDVVVPSIV